ncbi:unnamed protein product [Onchocerca flexuosa]|uniref:Uncharacterized protein n=1 Tax=Onchocerca flexuosa TaxID=387005 RepID=A0A183HQG3_9BILA|nr:unnamed protein product [Onchocerca flexuosa]
MENILLLNYVYDHTTLKARHLVRSVKLSNVGPATLGLVSTLDRRRPVNPRCCRHLLLFPKTFAIAI